MSVQVTPYTETVKEVLRLSLYNAEAIVIRVRDFDEADKVLTLLSRREGKLSVVAKGARRPRNRFLGASQLFSHLDVACFRGRSLDALSQAEIIETFRSLREDLVKLAIATYLCELTDALTQEKEPQELVFSLLLAALHLVEDGADPEPPLRAYELRLLSAVGYQPYLDGCVVCGRPLIPEATEIRLSPDLGGVVCRNCLDQAQQVVPIPRASFEQLVLLAQLDLRELEQVELTPAAKADLTRVTEAFLRQRVERPLKSLEFLKSVLT